MDDPSVQVHPASTEPSSTPVDGTSSALRLPSSSGFSLDNLLRTDGTGGLPARLVVQVAGAGGTMWLVLDGHGKVILTVMAGVWAYQQVGRLFK